MLGAAAGPGMLGCAPPCGIIPPPGASDARSAGNDSCGGSESGSGRNGILGRSTCAVGSIWPGPAAGVIAVAAGLKPGTVRAAPGAVGVIPGVPAAAGGKAGIIEGVAAGAGAVARPGIWAVTPGMVGRAGGVCGALIPALTSGGGAVGTGGVAPRAVAMLCMICGALAAVVISCPRLGAGAGGSGSAWAVPIKPPNSSAADEPPTMAVARNNVQKVGMTLPGARRKVHAEASAVLV